MVEMSLYSGFSLKPRRGRKSFRLSIVQFTQTQLELNNARVGGAERRIIAERPYGTGKTPDNKSTW